MKQFACHLYEARRGYWGPLELVLEVLGAAPCGCWEENFDPVEE